MCAYQRTIAHACPNAGVEKHDSLIKGLTCPTQGKGLSGPRAGVLKFSIRFVRIFMSTVLASPHGIKEMMRLNKGCLTKFLL